MDATPDPRFYEDATSLFVQAYDAFFASDRPQIAGDVEFYARVARETPGQVLELACGTGRIAIALAKAGHEVTGVDISEGMLTIARRKADVLPPEARKRLTLVRQDMTALDLGRRFGFIFVPFRSFQHLLTIDLQRRALGAARRHLLPRGRLALHLFDPRLDLLIDEAAPIQRHSGTDPVTGRRYVGEVVRSKFDHLAQIRRDLWRHAEQGPNGEVLREDSREMALRWTYRWELRHLLESCGFTVDAEYSDFSGSAPVYGRELVIVATKRVAQED
jgi:ubiquinone/menaquinone biosynthesis C-methylase UbiE